jgi:2-polyprenyl-3-methyl-5-hydroxy-6-metoxy-1,4-benzoquinol methylase
MYPPAIADVSRDKLLRAAQAMPWYHCIEIGDGVVTKGTFDLRPFLKHYRLPEDMTGMDVLDVGRASGFFSFEFERRGARVVATDIPTPLHKDYVGGDITRKLIGGGEGDRCDFYVAHRLRESRVESVVATLANLSEAVIGRRFDLVFVGSVLNHVRDPAGALQQVFAVTKGRVIIANPYERTWSNAPLMRLIGLDSKSLTTWWLPNVKALIELARTAGFQNVRLVSQFDLVGVNGSPKIPHAVIHAERLDNASTERMFREAMGHSGS